jgi:hypothetical protein
MILDHFKKIFQGLVLVCPHLGSISLLKPENINKQNIKLRTPTEMLIVTVAKTTVTVTIAIAGQSLVLSYTFFIQFVQSSCRRHVTLTTFTNKSSTEIKDK